MTILNSNKNKKDHSWIQIKKFFFSENSSKMIRNFRKKKKDVTTRSPRSTPKSLDLYQNLIWNRRKYTVCLPLKLQLDFRLDYF